ncbi:MAG: DNA alkylation repair protein [Candidatus Magasanikbacteria bacterium]|mgnify:CR=1 FL=1|jgi:3-methyladenine DNA glycosylase AlkD|nr:DNA alkylation repair protein [Candidatus Magasanikbacteria bacterium]
MNKNAIIHNIIKDLQSHIDPAYKKGCTAFFKESITIYGVRTPITRKIAKKYWQEIKGESKEHIFDLCEMLLEKGYMELAIIAFSFARNLEKQYLVTDFKRFESWLKKYVTNWALCDDFCTHAFGALVYTYPKKLLSKVFAWTKSKNRWEKRAAAVTLIHFAKKKTWTDQYLKTAKALMHDPDDLVQKGYGWMLKEGSNVWSAKIFNFVMDNKTKMSRTALRYAIEKYPKEMRKEALKK